MSINSLKTNVKKENEGEWYFPADDVGFKLKRAGGTNKAYKKRFAELMKPYAHKLRSSKTKDLDQIDRISAEALIMECLVDWEGFPEDPQPFSKELALEELMKDEWHDLLNMLADFASDGSNYRRDVEVQELGNS